jgi:ribosomal protein S18 acetylase RimI-like enzyme
MALTIKQLEAGSESILEFLALHDSDFDLDERGKPGQPLELEIAKKFLENPDVLFWVAFDEENPIGFLQCNVVPLRSGQGLELLLYEIGVHYAWRRQGIGKNLMAEMRQWIQKKDISTVWVLADNPEAVEFYKNCGFEIESPQPVYMLAELT